MKVNEDLSILFWLWRQKARKDGQGAFSDLKLVYKAVAKNRNAAVEFDYLKFTCLMIECVMFDERRSVISLHF